jgi:hypothetical protein
MLLHTGFHMRGAGEKQNSMIMEKEMFLTVVKEAASCS